MIGELEVAAREVYLRHMATDAVFLTGLARLGRWRDMTRLAFCVIVSGAFHNALMGIVAPDATDAFVPDGRVVALACSKTVRLETNVVDVVRTVCLNVLPGPVACPAEVGEIFIA
jgi:hypothetical protein